MRLLIVTTVSTTVKAFLLPYADHFRALGWNVEALAHGIEACDVCRPHFDRVHEIDWSRNPLDYRNLVRALREVRRVVAAGRFDVVHVHTPVAAFVTRAALAFGPRTGRPVVIYTAHGFHFQLENTALKDRCFALLERLAGRWTDFLITINRTDELAALRLRIVPPDRLRYMPGIGVDRDRFSPMSISNPARDAVRRELGVGATDPLFVMIAEFNPGKRHRDVVVALSRMKNGNARVVFVGDGRMRRAIEKQAEESGVAPRIRFAGLQSDVRPFILAARATLLTSAREGLPRSVMESLCCGVPVIGSDIRGTRDLLGDGGGKLYPVGDVNALAALLDWFADNPLEALNMGIKARESMNKYDIKNLVAMHEKLYDEARIVTTQR